MTAAEWRHEHKKRKKAKRTQNILLGLTIFSTVAATIGGISAASRSRGKDEPKYKGPSVTEIGTKGLSDITRSLATGTGSDWETEERASGEGSETLGTTKPKGVGLMAIVDQIGGFGVLIAGVIIAKVFKFI